MVDKEKVEQIKRMEMMARLRVKYLSAGRKVTHEQIAEALGMSIEAWQEMFENPYRHITLKQAACIAKLLNVSMHYLMLGE